MLLFFTIDVNSYQVKLVMFYSVQTTHLTYVGKIQDIQINIYNIALSQVVSNTNTMFNVVI